MDTLTLKGLYSLSDNETVLRDTIVRNCSYSKSTTGKYYFRLELATSDTEKTVTGFIWNVDESENNALKAKYLTGKAVRVSGVTKVFANSDEVTITIHDISEIEMSPLIKAQFSINDDKINLYNKALGDRFNLIKLHDLKYNNLDVVKLVYDLYESYKLLKDIGIDDDYLDFIDKFIDYTSEYTENLFEDNPSTRYNSLRKLDNSSDTVKDAMMAFMMNIEPQTATGAVYLSTLKNIILRREIERDYFKSTVKAVNLGKYINM